MAIHFVTGRPGAGKSFYSMKLIIEELRGTERRIVTNLAILQENLAEMLHEKHGDSFDLLNRLTIIEDEKIEYFYTHRGGDIPQLDIERNAKGRAEKFDIETAQATGGVFYILDEVHLSFGARNWQNMGNAAIYYSSQHRKLGDDCILITQAPKMVDTTFRNLAQDYTVLRNHGLEKLLFFKQPKVFSRQTFLNLPGPNETPMEKGTFRLDLDVANCYDTSQGVGIHSRGEADTKEDRRTGLPWWLGIIIFIGGVFLLAQIPSACGKFVSNSVNSASDSILDGVKEKFDTNSTDKNSTVVNTIPEVITNQVLEPITVAITKVPEIEEKVHDQTVIGWGFKPNPTNTDYDFIAFLSDGSKKSLKDGSLTGIHSDHVVDADGTKILLERGSIDLQQLLRTLTRGD